MRSNYRRIGDYVREVKIKNKDLSITDLRGINIDKHFMPSVANTIGTDMSKYKVVKKGQFACNRMHVGRDKRLPIALHLEDTSIIVSPAYTVFEIVDESLLDAEYLMMWFSRSEFDRETWFYTDSDVRGGLSLEDFTDIRIPILPIEKQREIVKEYNVILNRIKLNENSIIKLENLAESIYKKYFEEFDFYYNSNKMKYCEELDKDIPENWEVQKLGELINYRKGYAFKSSSYSLKGKPIIKVSNFTDKYIDNSIENYIELEEAKKYLDYEIETNDIVISTVGSWPNNPKSIVGKVVIVPETVSGGLLNQNAVRIRSKDKLMQLYIYYCLSNSKYSQYVISGAQGSANQASVTLEHIFDYDILVPDKNTIEDISQKFDKIVNQIQIKIKFNKTLKLLKEIILLKMSKMGE